MNIKGILAAARLANGRDAAFGGSLVARTCDSDGERTFSAPPEISSVLTRSNPSARGTAELRSAEQVGVVAVLTVEQHDDSTLCVCCVIDRALLVVPIMR